MNNQKIHVAVCCRVGISVRSEQNHFLRMYGFGNSVSGANNFNPRNRMKMPMPGQGFRSGQMGRRPFGPRNQRVIYFVTIVANRRHWA